MVEVRYVEASKRITGWCGDSKQFGLLKDRGGEIILILDIPLPTKFIKAYLFDEATNTLVDNPDFIPKPPPRDLPAEIDALKARVKVLEPKEM